jgi:hypothetical protein
VTCYGLHDYTLARNGKQRCQRCGYEYPPIWAWWAKDDPPDTGQTSLFGDAA